MGANELSREDEVIAKFTAKRTTAKGRPNGVAEDADHYLLAQAFVDVVRVRTCQPPVYVHGKLWRVDKTGLWQPTAIDNLAVEIGGAYGGNKDAAAAQISCR